MPPSREPQDDRDFTSPDLHDLNKHRTQDSSETNSDRGENRPQTSSESSETAKRVIDEAAEEPLAKRPKHDDENIPETLPHSSFLNADVRFPLSDNPQTGAENLASALQTTLPSNPSPLRNVVLTQDMVVLQDMDWSQIFAVVTEKAREHDKKVATQAKTIERSRLEAEKMRHDANKMYSSAVSLHKATTALVEVHRTLVERNHKSMSNRMAAIRKIERHILDMTTQLRKNSQATAVETDKKFDEVRREVWGKLGTLLAALSAGLDSIPSEVMHRITDSLFSNATQSPEWGPDAGVCNEWDVPEEREDPTHNQSPETGEEQGSDESTSVGRGYKVKTTHQNPAERVSEGPLVRES